MGEVVVGGLIQFEPQNPKLDLPQILFFYDCHDIDLRGVVGLVLPLEKTGSKHVFTSR